MQRLKGHRFRLDLRRKHLWGPDWHQPLIAPPPGIGHLSGRW